MRARLLAAIALGALPAFAIDTPQWPPPQDIAARMRELQLVIISRDSTVAQRDAAREELGNLLKSPAGRDKPTPDEKPVARAPRAAIEPFPSIVAPVNIAPPTPRVGVPADSGVARLEVVEPSKAIPLPLPSAAGRFAIDSRTGQILRDTPAGYIDPRTGQLHPH